MSELNIHLPSDTHAALLGAAEARHLTMEEFVQEALKELAAREAEEVGAIRAGLAQAEAGQCVPHDHVVAAVDRLLASKQ